MTIIGKTRSAVRVATLGAWTLGMVGAAQLHEKVARKQKSYRIWQSYIKIWARGLVYSFGVEQLLVNPVPAPAKKARLVIANHRSPMDIALLLSHCGGHVLSRDDLARWPILGLAARKAQTIFVNRQDHNSGVSAIRQMRDILKKGRTLIVFPEGTTYQGDEVRLFHAGIFTTIRGLDVEVLPVGLAYQPGSEFFAETFLDHIARVASRKTTRIAIKFGSPLTARGTHNEMALTMHQEVQLLVNEARNAYQGEADCSQNPD